jgi:tryptophanyl-tRNA synthetase
MSRMTQFKDKSSSLQNESYEKTLPELSKEYPNETLTNVLTALELSRNDRRVSVGLFNYPVLMAADILLYNATYVPVGDDQSQHLEFTRDIAERMNGRFGDIFTIPEAVAKQHEFFGKDQGLRIKDLVNPTKKMSKSDESGRGVIFLGDDPDAAAKKIMSATTDDLAEVHFNREKQPGISNLLEILALLRGVSRDKVVQEFEGQTRYGDFKKVVADEMRQFLADFQSRLAATDNTAILAKLQDSEQKLAVTANATLLRAQQAVGLRPRDI